MPDQPTTGSVASKKSEALRPLRISADELERFVVDVLKTTGVSAADGLTTAKVLVTTDTWGVFTHGTKLLKGYVRRLKGGGLKATGVPKVLSEGPAWASMDGDSSLGMVTSTAAMDLAISKSRKCGIGVVGVRNSCHFGGAGYYAVMAAEQGMIGMATANDTPSMTAPGARGRVMGTNPWAFAAPAGREKPLFLDIAMSTVAGGKVSAAQALGKPIPNDWLVNKEGLPTTNPADFVDGGSLQPMAAHKGYGLALMVESLGGLLSGAMLRDEIPSWVESDPARHTGHGACFIAIDAGTMQPLDQFRSRMDKMIHDLHETPKAAGSERIYVPGEMEWERRERALKEGILLPPDVALNLTALSADTGVKLGGTVS